MNDFDSFKQAMQFAQKQIYSGVQIGLYKTMKQTREEVIKASKEPKSGRSYKIKRGSSKRIHIASSESETSARIKPKGKHDSTMFSVDGLNATLGVNKNISYGDAVEFGTRKMKARGDNRKAGEKIAKEKLIDNILTSIKSKFNE